MGEVGPRESDEVTNMLPCEEERGRLALARM